MQLTRASGRASEVISTPSLAIANSPKEQRGRYGRAMADADSKLFQAGRRHFHRPQHCPLRRTGALHVGPSRGRRRQLLPREVAQPDQPEVVLRWPWAPPPALRPALTLERGRPVADGFPCSAGEALRPGRHRLARREPAASASGRAADGSVRQAGEIADAMSPSRPKRGASRRAAPRFPSTSTTSLRSTSSWVFCSP
jgi:hypothetical protein